jgi:hypothetical protein
MTVKRRTRSVRFLTEGALEKVGDRPDNDGARVAVVPQSMRSLFNGWVVVAIVAAIVASSGRASAADTPAALTPYDHAPPPAAAPIPAAVDPETPQRDAPLRLRPPLSAPAARPASGSDAGLIVGEVLAGVLTSTMTLIVAGVATGATPVAGVPLFLLAPAATGAVVCATGRASDLSTGTCGPPIAGAYLGSLLLIPTAFLFYSLASDGPDEKLGATLGGAILGYVVGTTVGAVIGWNVAKEPKGDTVARRPPAVDPAAQRQALADASARASWTEPLRPRGVAGADRGARLTVPLLAFRF